MSEDEIAKVFNWTKESFGPSPALLMNRWVDKNGNIVAYYNLLNHTSSAQVMVKLTQLERLIRANQKKKK